RRSGSGTGSKHPWCCLLATGIPPDLPGQRRRCYPSGSKPAVGVRNVSNYGPTLVAISREPQKTTPIDILAARPADFGRSDRSAQGDRPTLRSIRPKREDAGHAHAVGGTELA